MVRKWKSCLAVLLVLVLLLSLVPCVYAAEPDATIAANAQKDLRYLALDNENNGPNDLYYQQKIMNPVVEDAFVLWYNGKRTNYAISWTSSDPSLIRINDVTHMAELTGIPEEDREVTLTATMAVPYTSGSSETYPISKELVVQVPCKATRLQMDYDALTITNRNDVRENLPLVKQGKYGASIAWVSSNPEIITDDAPDNVLYDGGVVTRGDVPEKVTLTAKLSYDGKTMEKTFPVTVSAKPAEGTADYDHYLFACYAENYDWNQDRLTTEEIYFGLSDNGMEWININVWTLNNKDYTRPILRSNVGDMGTRDPHIIRSHDGDKFYVLATNLHAVGNAVPERDGAEFKANSFDCVNGNRDLVIWETNDLTDWGEPRLIQCNFASSGDTYAPEAIWDENKQAYLVYWASKDNAELNTDGTYKPSKVGKVYYCYTRDFYTFSEPTLWLSSTDDAMKNAFPTQTGEYDIYDTTIQYDPYDGLYYRFGTKNRLYVQTSESLDGPWSDAIALPGNINRSNVEAPTTYQLPDGSWMLLGDNYRQYVPYKAEHLSDFVNGNYQSMSFSYASNGPRYKHGTILSVTKAEYEALMTAFDDSIPVPEAPAEGEGYVLDYAAETISAVDGYELRAAASGSAPAVSGAVEDYMGSSLYVRKCGAKGQKPSEWAEVAIPVRPAAPSGELEIHPTIDSLTITNLADFAGCEFSLGDGWNDTGVFAGLEAATEYTILVRSKAGDAFASEAAKAEVCTMEAMVITFDDVKEGTYCYEAVYWAARNGITTGLSTALFGPNNSCTRGQMVTFLWRAAGKPEPKTENSAFTDVKRGAYYEKAVLWAVENGITSGMSATTFAPDKLVTRAQAVTFLWRAAGKPEAAGQNVFTDVVPGAFYEKAVAWAVEADITKGVNAAEFRPDSSCVRGQVVTFLYRARMLPA